MSDTTTNKSSRGIWIRTGIALTAIVVLAGGFIYWRVTSTRVYVDTASIEAPLIALAPSQAGTLEEVYVNVGDSVPQDTTVARVGNELIKSKVAGVIVSTPNNIGAQINPGTAVVTMVDPSQLRVVGKVDEDKGLDRIKVGDSVTFTVDAFGSKQFNGVIDEISPTSEQSGIVFNISGQREVKQFDVKARFDVNAAPNLKNGMSARMWIYGG